MFTVYDWSVRESERGLVPSSFPRRTDGLMSSPERLSSSPGRLPLPPLCTSTNPCSPQTCPAVTTHNLPLGFDPPPGCVCVACCVCVPVLVCVHRAVERRCGDQKNNLFFLFLIINNVMQARCVPRTEATWLISGMQRS